MARYTINFDLEDYGTEKLKKGAYGEVKCLENFFFFSFQLVGIISLVVFTAYIIKFALSTLDQFSDKTAPRYIGLLVIHLICVSWFTMDFALRLLFSPEKKAFFKNPYTWTDLVPLVLLYVLFFYPSLEKVRFLEMLVMLKAARIFQIFKLSYVLQVLVNTLKASSSELCLLLIIMAFVMVVFASFIYFLEKDEFASDFKSVPESMWWAVITMTTVSMINIRSYNRICHNFQRVYRWLFGIPKETSTKP